MYALRRTYADIRIRMYVESLEYIMEMNESYPSTSTITKQSGGSSLPCTYTLTRIILAPNCHWALYIILYLYKVIVWIVIIL